HFRSVGRLSMKPLFAAIALLVASAGFAQAQPPERLKPQDGMIIVPGLSGNLDNGEPVYRTPGAPNETQLRRCCLPRARPRSGLYATRRAHFESPQATGCL